MIQIPKIYAQGSTIGDTFKEVIKTVETVENKDTTFDFASVINSIVSFAVPLSIFCAGLLLSFAAFKMISSKGDPEALKDAREQIGNAVTGLIFILLSGAILTLISKIILPGS